MKPAPQVHGTIPWRLFEGYDPVEGIYDEMVEAPGRLRPGCEPFVRSIESLGRHELISRWENAKRTLRDNGVTYNVYGDPEGVDRPWTLDIIPLLISSAEWSRLEAALVQRTRLLNLILADLYGPQRLLREGLVPAALVLANPAFLRPCHGFHVPNDVYLHLHAVDLARAPNGQWWVLADRTQAPSGAGYTLENRIVLSRNLPEAFRDCQVQRLASFFRAQRDTLTALAPGDRDQPKVVLLTPGPYNETYFEDAYLARYLGFTLVEGGDLTVRDCRVFIKTLEGLQPVDVILRRVNDGYCDPLELRSDSALGVAGLVQAARAGNVTLANALGAGAIETAAIMPFLPSLSRHLLDEDLLLPSVGTWWCGQPAELQYVLDHLNELVVKRAFPSEIRQPIFGRKLRETEKSALAETMRAHPHDFVGQEQVGLATAPVWRGHRLEPRPIAFRAYVAAAGDSYIVMPGGLTRVASSRDELVVSTQRGGGSKDTWVLSDGPVTPVTLLPSTAPAIQRERRTRDLPSRVADNLFWLGRNAERAEHLVRLLRSVVARLADEDTAENTPELAALAQILVRLGLIQPRLVHGIPLRELEQELFALFKQTAPGGLRATLREVRRITSMVRDRLSIDTWRILNQLHQDFRLRHGRSQLDDVLAHLNRLITDLAAFSGMEMENMTRGHGWRFLDVGRRLERAVNLARLLRSAFAGGADQTAILEPLLEIADSLMTYRRRYFALPQLTSVIDLLVVDESNARALAFQLAALAKHVEGLPRDPAAPSPTQEQRLIAHASATLHRADIDALCRATATGSFPGVRGLLGAIEHDLCALSDAITYYYFSHAALRVS